MILSESPRIELLNMDCMDFMAGCKDKQFDLSICDPPYGINESTKDDGRNGYGVYTKKHIYKSKEWDNSAPDAAYFDLLRRKSNNQIIWGANHFIDNIPFNLNSPCWIVWDKDNNDNDFADCELAWTSFKTAVRKIKYRWNGMLQENMKNKEQRIHPTQKPVKLYEWLLTNYAKPGNTILDTHGGSFSSAIAAYRLGFDFTGIELDKDYFDAAVKRFKEQTAQIDMFKEQKRPEVIQLKIE